MEDLKVVPYVVLEAVEARSERIIKRLIIVLVISIIVNLLSNFGWLYVWNQYEYEGTSETRTYVQDGMGLNIIGNSNEVTDGAGSNLYQADTAQD